MCISGAQPILPSFILPRRLVWTAFCLAPTLVVMLGCDPASKNADASSNPPPAVVVLSEVTQGSVEEERRFFAEVTAASDANLSAAEAGRVGQVLVSEGDRVDKGQVLIVLDDQLARAALSEAIAREKQTQAKRAQAQLEVSRFEKMREEKVVSDLETIRKQAEAQTLDAATRGAEAQVAQGSERLRRHRIVAPFAGTVAARNVDPGDWINPGELALQLLTDEHIEVQVRVPSEMLNDLPDVEQVYIEREGARVEARLEGAVNALDPDTRTALLRLTPRQENPSWLRVGSSAFAVFSIKRRGGLTVPRDALVYGVADRRIVKVVDGKAQPVLVEVLVESGTHVLVRSDELQAGDNIVVKGNERLRKGQEVTTEGALVPPVESTDGRADEKEKPAP